MKLREAKLQTIKKWKGIITDLEQGGSGCSRTRRCGFCDYMHDRRNRGCGHCPADHICVGDQYGQFAGNIGWNNTIALQAARNILKEVRKISVSTGMLGAIKRSLGRIYK